MNLSRHFKALLASSAAVLCLGLAASPAQAQEEPGPSAVEEFRNGAPQKDVVQNRFILKGNRFELSPLAGYIPNDPMVRRYIGGLLFSYHFSEQMSAGAQLLYSPDLGEQDLKGLTNTLVQIAHGSRDAGANVEFQQPVSKLILAATFCAQWAPIYGKINLLGENVLNFDLYGVLGAGMLSLKKGYARYDQDVAAGQTPVTLQGEESEVKIPLSVGVGMNFFLNQSMALKIDARSLLYVDKKPNYGDQSSADANESQVYNDFVATIGVSIYFPKMQPRITNF